MADAENIVTTLLEGGAQVLRGKRSLREARGISPEAMDGLYGVAWGMYQSGRYADAVKLFELLCLYDHEQPRLWIGLGYCRRMLRDYQGAATALSYADLYLDAPDLEMYLNLAECLLALGRADAAAEHVRQALELTPDPDPALLERAQALQRQSKNDGNSP